MLEGLEISEIYLSEVLKDNDNKRIDSEYFRKQFLNFFKNIPDLKPLSYFVKDGYRVVYENTNVIEKQEAIEKDYPYFLQATDLKTPFIDTSNLFYVHEEDWERYPKGRIVKGEILIEVKGKIDKVAIVPDDFPEKTLVTGSLFKLTVNDKISKHILLTYLISKYGTAFKDRYKTNLLISFVSKPDLYRIPVPYFSEKLQLQIDNIFSSIFESNKKSKKLYSQAETLLLETLGLNNFEPTAEAVNVKSFKESFFISGRLDAEYYQPKYEEIINAIKLNRGGYNKLENFIENYSTGFPYKSESYSENGIPLIRINNIQNGELDLSNAANVPFEDVSLSPKDIANESDILISMSGTIGNSCKIPKGIKALVNQRIMRITPKNYNVEILPLVINSIIGKMQLERIGTGGVQTNISATDIKEILVPVFDKQTQQQISSLVSESFILKKQSEQLLETAKRAVEIAIEEGEKVAIQYIEDNNELN